jgi:LPXTG-motif cell wall-anchored protein
MKKQILSLAMSLLFILTLVPSPKVFATETFDVQVTLKKASGEYACTIVIKEVSAIAYDNGERDEYISSEPALSFFSEYGETTIIDGTYECDYPDVDGYTVYYAGDTIPNTSLVFGEYCYISGGEYDGIFFRFHAWESYEEMPWYSLVDPSIFAVTTEKEPTTTEPSSEDTISETIVDNVQTDDSNSNKIDNANTSKTDTPKTGESNNLIIYISLLTASVLGLLILEKKKSPQ